MSARVIKVKDQPILVGLEWEPIEATSSLKKGVREIVAKNKGVSAGVVVQTVNDSVLGLLPPKAPKMSAPSGAALLGYANQKEGLSDKKTTSSTSTEEQGWILVEKIEGSEDYWFVAIQDGGAPIPGTDVVVSFERVMNLIKDFSQAAFVVYSSDSEVRAIASDNALRSDSRGFVELVDYKKNRSASMPKPLSGADPMIFVVIGIFVLGIGGFFGWDYYSKMKAQEEAARAAADRAQQASQQQAQEQANYEEAVKEAILVALDQGIASVDSALTTPLPSDTLNQWVNIVNAIPMDHSGWGTQRVECRFETPETPICTVSLNRRDFAIHRILSQDFPDAVITGDSASYVVRGNELLLRRPDWSQLEGAQAMMMGLLSDLQFVRQAGISYTQTASRDITQAINMPQPPPSLAQLSNNPQASLAPPPVNTGIAKGTMSYSGSGLWQIEGLITLLNMAGIHPTSLTVTMGENGAPASWQMQADFYIRSSPSPVLPTILTPRGPINATFPEKHRDRIAVGTVQGGLQETQLTPDIPSEEASSEEEAVEEEVAPLPPSGP